LRFSFFSFWAFLLVAAVCLPSAPEPEPEVEEEDMGFDLFD
jgi:hypothetical protein